MLMSKFDRYLYVISVGKANLDRYVQVNRYGSDRYVQVTLYSIDGGGEEARQGMTPAGLSSRSPPPIPLISKFPMTSRHGDARGSCREGVAGRPSCAPRRFHLSLSALGESRPKVPSQAARAVVSRFANRTQSVTAGRSRW